MKNTLINKLNTVIVNIQAGDYADALEQLQNDILGKTNGCTNAGAPDRNDWINDCETQNQIYLLIRKAIQEVLALMQQTKKEWGQIFLDFMRPFPHSKHKYGSGGLAMEQKEGSHCLQVRPSQMDSGPPIAPAGASVGELKKNPYPTGDDFEKL